MEHCSLGRKQKPQNSLRSSCLLFCPMEGARIAKATVVGNDQTWGTNDNLSFLLIPSNPATMLGDSQHFNPLYHLSLSLLCSSNPVFYRSLLSWDLLPAVTPHLMINKPLYYPQPIQRVSLPSMSPALLAVKDTWLSLRRPLSQSSGIEVGLYFQALLVCRTLPFLFPSH